MDTWDEDNLNASIKFQDNVSCFGLSGASSVWRSIMLSCNLSCMLSIPINRHKGAEKCI